MAAVDDLMSSLRAEGVVDSEGRFTLDREQARSKMQRFQLADARLYVLELVQAAVLRGATAMRFDIDADDMRMRFDGEPFTAGELEDLYGSVFADGHDRRFEAVRQLAIAFNAAMSMNLSHIDLRTGSVRLTIRPGQADAITTIDPPHDGTTIHVRRRFALGVVLDFFRNLAGRLDEEQYLRERCAYASLPIDLEGTLVSRGLSGVPGSLVEVPFSEEGVCGVMALIEADRPTELRLVKDGVWIDTREEPSCGTHIIAVVQGDRLRKDVSQARIVADGAFDAVVRALRRSRWALWVEASRAAAAGRMGGHDIAGWIRDQLLDHATRSELENYAKTRELTKLVSWPDCRDPFLVELPASLSVLNENVRSPTVATGTRVTLKQLLETSADDPPGFATRGFDLLTSGDPPVILLTDDRERAKLRALLPGLRSRTRELARAEERERARLAFVSRPGEPIIPDHVPLLARAPIEAEGVRGEIGIDARLLDGSAAGRPMHALLFTQGCLLASVELDVQIPGLWLAIEADLEPNRTYDDALRNARFAHVLVSCLATLRELISEAYELAVQGDHEPAAFGATHRTLNPAGRAEPKKRGGAQRERAIVHVLERWLTFMLDPKHRRSVLMSLGISGKIASTWKDAGFELVPSLAPDRLTGAEVDRLAELPLLTDFADRPLGLVDVAVLHAERGPLPYLPADTDIEPLSELPGILRLSADEVTLLEALFGKKALVSWVDELTPRQAEARHMAQPTVDLVHDLHELRKTFLDQGIAHDLMVEALPDGRGFLAFAYAPGADAYTVEDMLYCGVAVLHRDRPLTTVDLELGAGALSAVVDDPKLTPSTDWTKVTEDQAFRDLHDRLRAHSIALVERVCAGFTELPLAARHWLGKVLLLVAARDADAGDRTMFERIRALPILHGVDGSELSLADVAAVIEAHGELEVLDDEHPGRSVEPPPMVVADAATRAALELFFGRKPIVDGSHRIQRAVAREALETRPEIAAPVLDPSTIIVRTGFTRPGVRAEVGLSQLRGGGLQLRLCTAGRLVGELEERFALPVDAIVADDELPVTERAEAQIGHKRIRDHVRSCRRAIPELVLMLAQRVATDQGDLPRAKELLLRHAIDEQARNEQRSQAREKALTAIAELSLFSDVWGTTWSLHEIVKRTAGNPVDVLERFRPQMPEGLTAATTGRIILTVDALERQCLERHCTVRVIDQTWAAELAELERLQHAPEAIVPDLDATALAHREATVSGNLEVFLWLPRDLDPLNVDTELCVVFASGTRELHRRKLLPFLACAGIVRGPSLGATAEGLTLNERQWTSLERQVVVLYEALADRVGGSRMSNEDRTRGATWLARAAVEIDERGDNPAAARLGTRIERLRTKLDDPKLVPPFLLEAVIQAKAPPATAEPPKRSRELERRDPAPKSSLKAKPSEPATTTPEQRLLAELDAQLHWARARHGSLLDELGLATMRIGEGSGLVGVEAGAIVIRRGHPIVARLLRQDPFDPFDLSFVIIAIYSLMNTRTEHIDDEDESAFVDQLAETLVLLSRARSGSRPPPSP